MIDFILVNILLICWVLFIYYLVRKLIEFYFKNKRGQ